MAENEVYPVPLREAFQVSSIASHAYTANLLADYCCGPSEYNATLLLSRVKSGNYISTTQARHPP